MSRNLFTAEQIMGLLWEANLKLSQGRNVVQGWRNYVLLYDFIT